MDGTGQWGMYNWISEDGRRLVHPDDVGRFKKLVPQGRVFECVGEENGLLVIRYGDERFRVKPDLFQPVVAPAYDFCDKVIVAPKGTPEAAVVCDILWHFRKEQPYFLVSKNGKRSGRRYWASELTRANA